MAEMAGVPDVAAVPERVKVGFSVTQHEFRAMEFVKEIHGQRYDGVASILRDYSIAQAVELYDRAQAKAGV